MEKERHVIETIECEDDDEAYTVQVLAIVAAKRSHDANKPPEWVELGREYRLDDGTPVNVIDKDTFKLLDGRVIKRAG